MTTATPQTAFALIGAAGYIAPRHMKAIRDVRGDLVIALDPNDSVGVIDSYFPNAEFTIAFEQFDRRIDAFRRSGRPVEYIGICSPNHLHDAHIRYALRAGADVICEKPLVLDIAALDQIADLERETGKRVNTVLQLRLHPAILALKEQVATSGRRHSVDLTYITSRGRWYHESWKGDEKRSGGVATNIGVHFFDMLAFVFGSVQQSVAHLRQPDRAAGFLQLENADVRWFLSIDRADLPAAVVGKSTYRSIRIDGEEVEFSEGFTELHSTTYSEVMAGRGFGLDEVRPSIEVVSAFRHLPIFNDDDVHPFVTKYRSDV